MTTSIDIAKDWLTIWQSESAAMAFDREAAESIATSLQLWQAFAAEH